MAEEAGRESGHSSPQDQIVNRPNVPKVGLPPVSRLHPEVQEWILQEGARARIEQRKQAAEQLRQGLLPPDAAVRQQRNDLVAIVNREPLSSEAREAREQLRQMANAERRAQGISEPDDVSPVNPFERGGTWLKRVLPPFRSNLPGSSPKEG